MSKTLKEIAQQLSTPQVTKKKTKQIPTKEIEESKPVPKVQLIYAFNGTGKTRLSLELKKLVFPKFDDMEGLFDDMEGSFDDAGGSTFKKILYYNAFTEDLFYWDNDLKHDAEPKLKIQPNSFTDRILKELKEGGLDQNIIANFQSYGNDKLTPKFNEEYKTKNKDNKEIIIPAYSEVTFSFQRGDDTRSGNIKISKGEESLFIWSLFYTLLKHLNELEPDERETSEFNLLEYVFIDDPVSSLDENHLIELAVSLADLIKRSGSKIKFIITTHNPLFYNVLYNEFSQKTGYLLNALEDGTFTLIEKQGDSNQSFSYHLYLKQVLEEAIENNQVQKYHFTLLRNLYEKTATFLGYPRWSELLPDDKRLYYNRIIQFTSHSTLSNEEVAEPTPQEKQTVKLLLNHLLENSVYNSKGTQNA